MAYVHTSVNQASEKYQRNEKRHNYTTPKSFLQQITLYRNLLEKSRAQLQHKMNRLDNGLQKLQTTAAQVKIFLLFFRVLILGFKKKKKLYFIFVLKLHIELYELFLFLYQVEDLKAKLALQEAELTFKNQNIETLISKIGQQTERISKKREAADVEAQKVR